MQNTDKVPVPTPRDVDTTTHRDEGKPRVHAVVGLSGGLDSTVLLARLLDAGYDITAVSFNYGSRHNEQELKAAGFVAGFYGVRHVVVNIPGAFPFAGGVSVLMRNGGTADPIPEGHYQEESMRQTVVPGRNLIFLAVLASVAESVGAKEVAVAVHAGDHYIYPDCRPAFVSAARSAVKEGSGGKVAVYAPFVTLEKHAIVKLGQEVKAPFHLTRTCYTGNAIACGRCGSCQERLAAFAANDAADPIEYADRTILPKSGRAGVSC